ncbi:MAG: terminase small subunit [Clostridia bacterium]|nr:terminase small subunit [Clostridia bacterium]
MPKKLTEKERLFCSYYAQGGDARGCAARAGFSLTPQRSAARLLAKSEIRTEIMRLESERKNSSAVERGLHRLAFGSVADALRLLLCEETMSAEEIEKLDFFNVSEIKRPKGGGLEIKFFDRLKALEKLEKLGSGEEKPQSSFIQALSEGARLISREDEDE